MTTKTDDGPVLEVGALYRITGELGTFKLMSLELHKDGSASLYGGTSGMGAWRCAMPHRLLPENRKHVKAVAARIAAGKVK